MSRHPSAGSSDEGSGNTSDKKGYDALSRTEQRLEDSENRFRCGLDSLQKQQSLQQKRAHQIGIVQGAQYALSNHKKSIVHVKKGQVLILKDVSAAKATEENFHEVNSIESREEANQVTNSEVADLSEKNLAKALEETYQAVNNGFEVHLAKNIEDIQEQSDGCDVIALHVISPVDSKKEQDILESFRMLRNDIPSFVLIQRERREDHEESIEMENALVLRTDYADYTKVFNEMMGQQGEDFYLQDLIKMTSNRLKEKIKMVDCEDKLPYKIHLSPPDEGYPRSGASSSSNS